MRLSMWILADWLEKYHPIISIESGDQVLRGARILSSDIRIEPQNVYLAPAEEFISSQRNKMICVHGRDMLLLDTMDMNGVLNDILDAFDYYNSWSDGLVKDITNGCELQHLVEQSYGIFREPIVVFDAGHIVIAHTMQYGPDDVDNEWKVMMQTGSNSFAILNKMKDHLYQSRYHHDVRELDFPFFADQCRLTLQVALEKQGGIYLCSDHALDYIRNIIHTAIDQSVVHPALYILKKNDEENENDLYKTLYIYLQNNCNLAHTARALNLHRNSLLYRLNKIRGLVNLDLDAEKVREYLRLSYIVLEG